MMKKLSCCLALSLSTLLTGCFTNQLLSPSATGQVSYIKPVQLFEDEVMGFGQPTQTLPHLNGKQLVIIGQHHSYVLTQGGDQFYQLLTHPQLDPKQFQIIKDLTFTSKNNDGQFDGTLPLSYVKLVEDISKQDRSFFIQHGARECSLPSDTRLGSQRFCFDIALAGVIYPQANNATSLKRFSQPYKISIQTLQKVSTPSQKNNPIEKLMLFPFAVAFDVITLPIQIADKILD